MVVVEFSYQQLMQIEVVISLAIFGLVLFAVLTFENKDERHHH